jgi:hypothetical protein
MATLVLAAFSLHAQDKPDETPRVLMCIPLGVLPGETTKVTARGLKLEGATEVKAADARVQAKMTSQGKTAVPQNQNAAKVGDNQVEFELVVPADFPAGNLEIVVVTPKGEARYALPVGGELPTIVEKEPNAGFKQSQALQLSQIVVGRIENPNDVDVYSIDAPAGQKILCEVFAERLGSGLDALLTIYDSTGHVVATHDDLPDSRDARLEFTATAAGKFFVVVQDANDQGGPAHPYRLSIRLAP